MTYPEPHEPHAAHPLLDRLSHPKSLMVIAGVVVLAGVAAAFAFGRGEHGPAAVGGPEMQLALVAPIEPAVQPGERMDVGALTNGFNGEMPAPPVDPDRDPALDQPAYVETGWGSDTSWRRNDTPPASYDLSFHGEPMPPPPRDPPPEPREDPRAFGFDRPQPDYRAERDARRAAMDARMEAERRNPRRIHSSDPDSEFY